MRNHRTNINANNTDYTNNDVDRTKLSPPSLLSPTVHSLSSFENNFQALNYLSNYKSVLSTTIDELHSKNIKLNNEVQLSKYYEFKKSLASVNSRQNSIVSTSDSSNVQSDKSKNINSIMDKFLSFSENDVDPYKLKEALGKNDDLLNSHASLKFNKLDDGGHLFDSLEKDSNYFINSNFTNSYYKYYKKLLTVDMKDYDILKKHNLWIPSIRQEYEDLLLQDYLEEDYVDKNYAMGDVYKDKTCPLFMTGAYNLSSYHAGHSILPSIFSEFKLPSLIYHSAVEINGQVFILGGLMACYRNDKEKPNLDNYYVDGIKNLPPPLLHDVINNPAMINNPYLYVQSVNSARLSRPEISGQIPPPLLCMTSTKLTDRYLLFYGGIEVQTETNFDTDGIVFIRKRVFLNNTAYILDTMSFKFTKIEVNTQSFEEGKAPTFSPRFGHMQLAVDSSQMKYSYDDSVTTSVSSLTIDENSATQKSNNTSDFQKHDIASLNSPIDDVAKPMTPTTSLLMTSNYSSGNNVHGSNVLSILIYGGYRQTVDDKYEALDDMWKLDLNIVARNKKGYLKFADSIVASNIPIVGEEDVIPNARAFFAYGIPNATLFGEASLEYTLLRRLENEFCVDSNLFNDSDSSTLLFPNIPHGSHRQKIDKVVTNSSTNTVSTNRTNVNAASSSPLFQSNVNSTNEKRSSTNDSGNSILQNHLRSVNESNGSDMNNSDEKRKVIVIHGGSNGTEVFGDMWWLDLENMKWLKIDTFTKSGGKTGEELEKNQLKLVGHTMVSAGYAGIYIGGMTQESVNEIYKENYEKNSKSGFTANGLLNVINLRTQCLVQGGDIIKVSSKSQEESVKDGKPNKLRCFSSVGFTTAQSDGTVLLVGGGLFHNLDYENVYLRGAILEFILPAMSLPV